jgi:MYXO-CTERM domain-containing protein
MSCVVAVLLLVAAPCAASVIFAISVDTTEIDGSSGYLDLQFNPGTGSQRASAFISNLSGGTPTGSAVLSGGASSVLPGAIEIDNTGAFNDYFQSVTFGSDLFLEVAFSGDAIDNPNSGNSFDLGIASDNGGDPFSSAPYLYDNFSTFGNPDSAVHIDLEPDLLNPGSLQINTDTGATGNVSVVPEPAPGWLVAVALLALALRRRVSRNK